MQNFSTKAHGKWILIGEHAVLRGVPAIVFPILSRSLDLRFEAGPQALEVELHGVHGPELEKLVWTVIDKACEMKQIPRSELQGRLYLESSIPVGAGMGASACLCVVLTRWLGHLGYVPESEAYEFSRSLENIFHGESSGLDIAVALSGQGLYFRRDGHREVIAPKWKPHWYISYSGKRGVTLECVNKVKALISKNRELGHEIDQQMRQAVQMSQESLMMTEEQGFDLLAQAITLGCECFERWGLTEGAPSVHMQNLLEAGAVAVKPTGSGGGGYVLSLWKGPAPIEWREQLIPCM